MQTEYIICPWSI